QATAALIEQRLLLEFTLDEKLLCDRLFARANRMPADAMLAVDCRGRVMQFNAAAERLLTVRRSTGGQTLRDELRPVVEAALERGGGHPEGYEQTIGSRALGGPVRIVLPSRRHWSRRGSSVTKRARSPERWSGASAASSSPTAGPSSSTRWAIFRPTRSSPCCASSRSESSSVSGGTGRSGSMYG